MPDAAPEVTYERDEDFTTLYANSVQFESSAWDLKLIFGILDQAIKAITNHTAVCLPWPHAKLAAYYFLVNVLFYQANEGPITLPQRVIPPRPDPSAPDVDPKAKPLVEYLGWVHDQFFGANPYIPPAVQKAQEKAKADAEK